jgi:hypothetical protein
MSIDIMMKKTKIIQFLIISFLICTTGLLLPFHKEFSFVHRTDKIILILFIFVNIIFMLLKKYIKIYLLLSAALTVFFIFYFKTPPQILGKTFMLKILTILIVSVYLILYLYKAKQRKILFINSIILFIFINYIGLTYWPIFSSSKATIFEAVIENLRNMFTLGAPGYYISNLGIIATIILTARLKKRRKDI